jgi:hypothetical protein
VGRQADSTSAWPRAHHPVRVNDAVGRVCAHVGTYGGVFVVPGLLCFGATLIVAGLRARRLELATASP